MYVCTYLPAVSYLALLAKILQGFLPICLFLGFFVYYSLRELSESTVLGDFER